MGTTAPSEKGAYDRTRRASVYITLLTPAKKSALQRTFFDGGEAPGRTGLYEQPPPGRQRRPETAVDRTKKCTGPVHFFV